MVNTTRRKIQHFIARTTDKEIMKTFEWTSHPHRKEKTDGWMDGWLTDCWTMDWPTTLLLFVCVLFVLNPPRGFLFLFQGGRWRVSNYLYVYGLGGWGSKRQKEMNNREIESAGGRERERNQTKSSWYISMYVFNTHYLHTNALEYKSFKTTTKCGINTTFLRRILILFSSTMLLSNSM